MRPTVRRVRKALLAAFERAEVTGDVSEISTISKLLLTIDEAEATEEAAADVADPLQQQIVRIIVDGWERLLTDDERAQFDALRALASARGGIVTTLPDNATLWPQGGLPEPAPTAGLQAEGVSKPDAQNTVPGAASPVGPDQEPGCPCPYCRRACLGPDHPAFGGLHYSDPVEVQRRVDYATAEMFESLRRSEGPRW